MKKSQKEKKMEFVKTIVNEDDKKQALFFLPENGKYYLYSYVNHDYAHETMVFECDADGEVENHMDLAMGSGYVPSWEIMEQVNV
jgi:glutathionyl-hydroquinone reductase